jgi:uncharacterized RDD family membrane protein YckC
MNNPYSPPQVEVKEEVYDKNNDLASSRSRLGAAILDNVIGVIAIIPAYLYKIYILNIEWNAPDSFEYQAGLFIYSAITFLVINGYFLVKSGQTCGKKLFKIKMVTVYYTKPSLFSLTVVRTYLIWLISYIPWLAIVWLIDILLIFRKDRRCVHDHMAKTIVVNDWVQFNAE